MEVVGVFFRDGFEKLFASLSRVRVLGVRVQFESSLDNASLQRKVGFFFFQCLSSYKNQVSNISEKTFLLNSKTHTFLTQPRNIAGFFLKQKKSGLASSVGSFEFE